jgi:hypothetical protein
MYMERKERYCFEKEVQEGREVRIKRTGYFMAVAR